MKKVVIFTLLASLLIANAGMIASLKGEASLLRAGKKIKVKLGDTLDVKDELQTTKNTKVQIIMNDKSIFTIGANSIFVVDDFVQGEQEKADFSIKKGFFKAITGEIGKRNPQKFGIKTTNATIGIRGTQIVGEVSDKKDKIACIDGRIVVASLSNPSEFVEVLKGQVTEVAQGEAPTQPKAIEKNDVQQSEQESESDAIQEPVPTAQPTVETQTLTSVTQQTASSTLGGVGAILKTYNGYSLGFDGNVGDVVINIHEGVIVNEYKAGVLSGEVAGNILGGMSIKEYVTSLGYTEELDELGDIYNYSSFSTQDTYYYGFIVNYKRYGFVSFVTPTEYVSWGTWIAFSLDESATYESGNFVYGELTPSSVVDGYIAAGQNYHYTGSSFNGSALSLKVDFGSTTAPLAGTFGRESISGGTIKGNGFSYSGANLGLNGSFYGPAANAIAGSASVNGVNDLFIGTR